MIKDEKEGKEEATRAPQLAVGPPRPPLVIPWEKVADIVFAALGPAIKRAIRRKPQKLPVTAAAHLHPIFHSAYFGTLEERTLSTEQELLDVFGHYTRREFKLGSYAVMAPNVTIKFMANTAKTQMKLKYHVYNCYNVLQWPESYSFED
ncbi:hypothetical protein QOT17_007747 [Balamuthia mandrillaris]